MLCISPLRTVQLSQSSQPPSTASSRDNYTPDKPNINVSNNGNEQVSR